MNAPEGALKAIVAYEPGASVFPVSDAPTDTLASRIPLCNDTQAPQLVADEEFEKLTKFPIMIVFGDNVATEESDNFNSEVWRVAKRFVEAVNRHGGDAQLLVLPEIGIYGNSHAAFSDLNNHQMADLLEKFLHEKGLADSTNPYTGQASCR